MVFFTLNKYIKNINTIKSIDNNFDFYIHILITFLNCKFINFINKKKLLEILEFLKLNEK